jgi:hypothetical protein
MVIRLSSLVTKQDGQMSVNENADQITQYRDEPTASATQVESANSLRQQRPGRVHQFASWAWLVAGVMLIVVVIAAIFFAGFSAGRHYGGSPSDNYFVAPGEGGCIQMLCQPNGPHGGAQCMQKRVACPSG